MAKKKNDKFEWPDGSITIKIPKEQKEKMNFLIYKIQHKKKKQSKDKL